MRTLIQKGDYVYFSKDKWIVEQVSGEYAILNDLNHTKIETVKLIQVAKTTEGSSV